MLASMGLVVGRFALEVCGIPLLAMLMGGAAGLAVRRRRPRRVRTQARPHSDS